jgi:hypothetical protein
MLVSTCNSCEKKAEVGMDWLTCGKYIACSRACADGMDTATKTQHEWKPVLVWPEGESVHTSPTLEMKVGSTSVASSLKVEGMSAASMDVEEDTKPEPKAKRSKR